MLLALQHEVALYFDDLVTADEVPLECCPLLLSRILDHTGGVVIVDHLQQESGRHAAVQAEVRDDACGRQQLEEGALVLIVDSAGDVFRHVGVYVLEART